MERVELEALWSALPGANLPPSYGSWSLALPFQPVYFDRGRDFTIRAHRGYLYLRGQAPKTTQNRSVACSLRYPDAAGARLEAGG